MVLLDLYASSTSVRVIETTGMTMITFVTFLVCCELFNP